MTLRVKQAFCKVNNKIQQLRGDIKLPLPYCLFSKQLCFSPLSWTVKGQEEQKNAGENRKINQKFGSTEQSTYLCTRFSPTNVK